MWVQLLIFKLHFSIFVCPIKFIAKRKLEISNEKDVTVYTEDDGTEIDEDTFSAFDSGSTFICAAGNETWLPTTTQEESNIPRSSSSVEVNTIQTSDTVTVTQSAKVGVYKLINIYLYI